MLQSLHLHNGCGCQSVRAEIVKISKAKDLADARTHMIATTTGVVCSIYTAPSSGCAAANDLGHAIVGRGKQAVRRWYSWLFLSPKDAVHCGTESATRSAQSARFVYCGLWYQLMEQALAQPAGGLAVKRPKEGGG
jgi:hypothetical protein